MKELVDLISSITVLVAALAGISAINKWKRERFDKAKIESIEEYESCLRSINKKLDSILEGSPISFCLNEDGSLNNNYKQLELYFKSKRKNVDELKSEVARSEHFFDIYSGYAGNNLVFINNYYQTIIIYMERALLGLEMEVLKLGASEDEELVKKGDVYLLKLLKEEGNGFTYEGYMMLAYNTMLLSFDGVDKSVFKDERRVYEDAFKRIVSAEKMALHKAIHKRFFIKLKVFIMKYRLVGKVLHMTDEFAVVVSVNGAIKIVDTNGEKYKKIEKQHRAGLLKRLLKAEVSRLFS